MKVGIASSSGGHLFQLFMISRAWEESDRFWVSVNTPDVRSLLRRERLFFAHFPESRNIVNAVRNFFFAVKVLRKEKPSVVISCGAGIAPPFFVAAKIMGIHTIYIEPIDFIQAPSLTGAISQYLVDLFLVQHPSQKQFFRREAHYWGSTLNL